MEPKLCVTCIHFQLFFVYLNMGHVFEPQDVGRCNKRNIILEHDLLCDRWEEAPIRNRNRALTKTKN